MSDQRSQAAAIRRRRRDRRGHPPGRRRRRRGDAGPRRSASHPAAWRRGALSGAGRAHERRRADRGSGRRHPLCQRPALRIDRLSDPRVLVGRTSLHCSKASRRQLVPEATAEASLLRNGDDAMPVAVWSRPISIGDTTATLVRLTDLSIHRRAEQIAAAERFARSVLEQATEAVVVLSPDGPHHPRQLARRAARRAAAGRPHLFRGVSARSAEHGRGGTLARFLRRKPRHHAGDQAVSRRRSEAARRTYRQIRLSAKRRAR